jgi:NAD(P)-dependent dehydrogenase (short-subunit alcohol dehydrogenase family)
MQQTLGQPLAGRRIIVTGASSGVGYALTRRLVQQEGATVIAVARRRVFRIEALVKQVGEDRLIPITADMAAPGESNAVVQQAEERWGHIDAFVHCVNRALRLSALDVSDAEFDMTMQVNVKSALYGVQATSAAFRRQGSGAIIIYNPIPVETEAFCASEAVYSAAAHALSALTAGWARQLEHAGIAVQEVTPVPDEDSQPVGRLLQHDVLLLDALRSAILAPPVPGQKSSPAVPAQAVFSESSPIILKARGGLSLTQF